MEPTRSEPDGSSGTSRTSPADWIRAGIEALRRGGVSAVRVEPLATELGVTKGSFYWHFRDRAHLLEAILSNWEEETRWLVRQASRLPSPSARAQRYFELVAGTRHHPPDSEILAWARHDRDVARRVEATERRRLAFIRRQFIAAGLPAREAARRAEVAYLATQGRIERISRGAGTYRSLPRFTRQLFALLLPAPGSPSIDS